jgi:hypothetical protein
VEIDPKSGKVTATVQELASYSMFLAEALFEVLEEKGLLSEAEIKERVRRIRDKTTIKIRRPQ